MKIELFSLLVSIIFLAVVLVQVWRQRLKEAYALLWILIGAGFMVVSLFHGLLKWISDVIGIVYPPATLFLLLSAGIFLILFQYSLILSRRTEEVKRLTQELALLEERLRRLEKRGDE